MTLQESDLITLTKEKPLVTKEKVLELDELLQRLPESARYDMTAGLQVAQFLTSSPFPPEHVEELTLKELCDEGTLRLVLVDGINDEHIDDLNSVLRSIIETSEDIIDHPGRANPIAVPQHIPRYSSVEAERLLREGILALKRSESFDSVKEVRIEDRWPEDAVSAPFIEAMTFDDLTKVEVESLLKKRSMTDTKIYYLIELLKEFGDGKDIKKVSQTRFRLLPPLVANWLIRLIKRLSADNVG